MSRVVLLMGLVLLPGCLRYHQRRIELPATPQAEACRDNATAEFERCIINQRGRGYCFQLRDELLVSCPGARDLDSTKVPVESSPQLPGYRP